MSMSGTEQRASLPAFRLDASIHRLLGNTNATALPAGIEQEALTISGKQLLLGFAVALGFGSLVIWAFVHLWAFAP
jgi:hypothetical protein